MNNRYTQPSHKGISTAHQRRTKKPHSKRRKYLREPLPKLDTGWIMDYDVQHMYLGSSGWTFGNGMIWGSPGSGKSQISTMYFSKLRGAWQTNEPKKECDSPFKNA